MNDIDPAFNPARKTHLIIANHLAPAPGAARTASNHSNCLGFYRDGVGNPPAARLCHGRGLIVTQALTLFTTPLVYLYLDRLSNTFRPLGPFVQS
jgi:hypothetical protein